MGKVAFLFSGQGAQKVSMGEAFYHASPAARAVYDQADALSGGMAALLRLVGIGCMALSVVVAQWVR